MTEIRVLVCGAGSIGMRHLRNLLSIGVQTSLWRARSDKLDEIGNAYKIPVFADLDLAIDECDAVVVATETDKHMGLIEKAAEAGKHLYIEKPVSHTLAGTAPLKKIVQQKNIIVEIGCMLRASPTLQKLKHVIQDGTYGPVLTFRSVMGQRLDQWRLGTNYQQSYSADRRRGGGALMDLIHQIDLVEYLLGPIKDVSCTCSNAGPNKIYGEDLAHLTLTTNCGQTGQIQVDMISPIYRGQLEIVMNKAVAFWNIENGLLTLIGKDGQETIRPPEKFERNHLFLNHMKEFLARIADRQRPALADLNAGISALEVVLTAYEADKENCRLAIRRQ